MNEREQSLWSRREFLVGAASLSIASAALIFEAQEALARNSRKDIERILLSGKYDEAIAKVKKEIRDTFGIYVDFPAENIELREDNDEATYFARLTEKTTQIGSLLDLRRYLLKFPPMSAPGLTKLSPIYLQQIVIASKVEGRTRSDGRYEVDGFAFPQKTRIALKVIEIHGPNGKMRYSIDKQSLTHEISHMLLRDISEQEWIGLITKKIAEEYKDSFPENYGYSPVYVRRRMSEYNVRRPRPHGFAQFYGTDNFKDDIATVAEVAYHGTVSRSEIDSERPPLLKVKLEVIKEKLAEKIGYSGRYAASRHSYWSLVSTSSSIDTLLDKSTSEAEMERKIDEEFNRWEQWWKLHQ